MPNDREPWNRLQCGFWGECRSQDSEFRNQKYEAVLEILPIPKIQFNPGSYLPMLLNRDFEFFPGTALEAEPPVGITEQSTVTRVRLSVQ